MPNLWLILFFLGVRAIFLLLGQAALGGDGLGYVISAQEILTTGKLPPTPSQPVSISVLLLPILALIGEPAMIDYRSRSYPGYPGFINDPIADSFHIIQVVMDLAIVFILILEAQRVLRNHAPRWLSLTVIIFLAMQPFTAMFTPHVLSDHSTMFAFFVGGYLLFRYLADTQSIWYLIVGALLLGVAGWLRFDMLPVVAALVGFLLLKTLYTYGFARVLRIAALTIPLIALAPTAMLIFQYKSTAEIGYIKLGIFGEAWGYGTEGYYAWVRKWLIFYPKEMQVAGWASEAENQSWAGYNIDNYPKRAFRDEDEKQEIDQLLKTWKQNGYTLEINNGFQRIADAHASHQPLMSFVLAPTARTIHYWINLEGARAIQATFSLKPPWSQVATALVFPFRVLVVLLGFIGLWVVLVTTKNHYLNWQGQYAFAQICAVMVLLRTVEMGVIGTMMQSGLMEPRYIIPAFPAMLILAAVGASKLTTLNWQRLLPIRK